MAVRDSRSFPILPSPLATLPGTLRLIRDFVAYRGNLEKMAGLEHLATQIYHEKQEPGSALCAQHALNSLLRVSLNLCHMDVADSPLEGNYVRCLYQTHSVRCT
jgi:hypothetical protein